MIFQIYIKNYYLHNKNNNLITHALIASMGQGNFITDGKFLACLYQPF